MGTASAIPIRYHGDFARGSDVRFRDTETARARQRNFDFAARRDKLFHQLHGTADHPVAAGFIRISYGKRKPYGYRLGAFANELKLHPGAIGTFSSNDRINKVEGVPFCR